MDHVRWLVLGALCAGLCGACGAADDSEGSDVPSDVAEDTAGVAGAAGHSSRASDVLRDQTTGATAQLGDGGALEAGSGAIDGGFVPPEVETQDAGVDTGSSAGSAATVAGAGGSAGIGGSGGSGEAGSAAEPECSTAEPCLLDSVEIARATKALTESNQAASVHLGSPDPSEPFYLHAGDEGGEPVLSPRSFVFSAGTDDAAAEAAAHFENGGTWAGRASICMNGPCWYIQQATLAIPAGSTITSFVAVIDPLTLEPDGDNTKATIGGRWEVWGYGP